MAHFYQNSIGAARRALILGLCAMVTFVFPFVLTLGLELEIQGLGLFWVISVILMITATASSVAASRRGEWGHPQGGKRFLVALYGLPVFLALVIAAWCLKK